MTHSITAALNTRVPASFPTWALLILSLAYVAGLSPAAMADGPSTFVGFHFWTDDKGNTYFVNLYKDDDGYFWTGTWLTKDGDKITVTGDINPAPEDAGGEYVFPWQNPLNPGQSTYPMHPAVVGLERALQMDGGDTLVHGGRNRDSLVNPADDDGSSGKSGPKPKTQSTGNLTPGVPILDQAILAALEEKLGAANGLALDGATYVQLHNPAETQGGPVTDGDDDAPTTPGQKKDDPVSPEGNGIPSLWDAAFVSLINPDPTSTAGETPQSASLILVSPSGNGSLARNGAGGSSTSPQLNFAGFGAPTNGRTPRPPR
jgi:hypothetical protein